MFEAMKQAVETRVETDSMGEIGVLRLRAKNRSFKLRSRTKSDNGTSEKGTHRILEGHVSS
jgi:hypothetical protein